MIEPDLDPLAAACARARASIREMFDRHREWLADRDDDDIVRPCPDDWGRPARRARTEPPVIIEDAPGWRSWWNHERRWT